MYVFLLIFLICWANQLGLLIYRRYCCKRWLISNTSVQSDLFELFFNFYSVRLLSVLRGHSVFSSPPQRPMNSDIEGFSIPDLIHYIYFPILILEKEPVFPFLMLRAKQGKYWYHFYNVFGMMLSLTGD